MLRPLGTFLVALVFSLSSGAAHASTPNQPSGFQPSNPTWLQQWDQWADQFGDQFEDWIDGVLGIPDVDGGGAGSGGTVAAPEFDPSVALAALTLLVGGLAVLRGRRSGRKDC